MARKTYLGLDGWNVGRFATGLTGLGFNGFAIWEHNLWLIILGFSLGGVSQFLNLVRHSKQGQNGNGHVEQP